MFFHKREPKQKQTQCRDKSGASKGAQKIYIALTHCLIFVALGCSQKSYPPSDHYDGHVFLNPQPFEEKEFSDLLKWFWNRETPEPPAEQQNPPQTKIKERLLPGQVAYTFIGHATVLLQVGPLNILTDPIFSERASPISFLGPKRYRKPGLSLNELPPIDLVLISHNHYDHMDQASVRALSKAHSPLFVTSLGNKKLLKSWGAQQVIELDWFQSHELSNGVTIELTQTQHFSARGLFDRNKTLWGGFMIDSPEGQIFFAGDTGYGDFFKELSSKYNQIILALIPIGAYEPRWFMRPVHTNPKEALQIHRDIRSQYSLGIHWGTFILSDEKWDQPARDLETALKENPLTDGSQFEVTTEGHFQWIKQQDESERKPHRSE